MIFATSASGLIVFLLEAELIIAGLLFFYYSSIVGRRRLGLLMMSIGCISTSITFIALNETDKYIRAIGMLICAVYALYELYKLHSPVSQQQSA